MGSTAGDAARVRALAARVRGASLEALESLRDALAEAREALAARARAEAEGASESASAAAGGGAAERAGASAAAGGGAAERAGAGGGMSPAVAGELAALAIAEGAVETAVAAAEDGEPLVLSADAERVEALRALAAAAGPEARDRIQIMINAEEAAHPGLAGGASGGEPAADTAAGAASGGLSPAEILAAEREARTADLDGEELAAAMAEAPEWPVAALAGRLAALGRVDEARAFVGRWAGGGWYRAHALLRAASAAPALTAEAAVAVAALEPPARARLCGENPSAAVRVLGPAEVLRLADEGGDEFGQYVRIVALARVAGALPEPERSEAAARALRAYREDPDPDAVGELVRCAPWMPRAEAAVLLVETLGRLATPRSFASAFRGYAGIAPLAPLIARAAGDPGLVAAAEAVAAAAHWA